MVISAESLNCFKARECSPQSDEFALMIQGMLERGVKVEVLEPKGEEKRFCLN